MPRPKRHRKMDLPPAMLGFKPFGIPLRELEAVELLLEEFEAIKLADYENLTQEQAAPKMGVSRPTFTRIYEKARKTIARALAESKVIVISGGHVKFNDDWFKCRECEITFVREATEQNNCGHCESDNIIKIGDRETKIEAIDCNENKKCYCLQCDIELTHKKGIPCYSLKCPYCESNLTGMNVKRIDRAK